VSSIQPDTAERTRDTGPAGLRPHLGQRLGDRSGVGDTAGAV